MGVTEWEVREAFGGGDGSGGGRWMGRQEVALVSHADGTPGLALTPLPPPLPPSPPLNTANTTITMT